MLAKTKTRVPAIKLQALYRFSIFRSANESLEMNGHRKRTSYESEVSEITRRIPDLINNLVSRY